MVWSRDEKGRGMCWKESNGHGGAARVDGIEADQRKDGWTA